MKRQIKEKSEHSPTETRPLGAETAAKPNWTAVVNALQTLIADLDGSEEQQDFFIRLAEKLELYTLSEACFLLGNRQYGIQFGGSEDPAEIAKYAQDLGDLYNIMDTTDWLSSFIQTLLLVRRQHKEKDFNRELTPHEVLYQLTQSISEFDVYISNARSVLQNIPNS